MSNIHNNIQEQHPKKPTAREMSKAGHSGKLSRKFNPANYCRVKTEWNPFEKILLRRIYKNVNDKNIKAVYKIYMQYAKQTKTNLIREKDFAIVKKEYNKISSLAT